MIMMYYQFYIKWHNTETSLLATINDIYFSFDNHVQLLQRMLITAVGQLMIYLTIN